MWLWTWCRSNSRLTPAHTLKLNKSSITRQVMTMMHYYNSGETPNEYEYRMEDSCLQAAPRQCHHRMTWWSRYPSLQSRSHCPDQLASSGKHAKYPLCLHVRYGDSGSSSKQQANCRLGPKRSSCYETSLL
jgi:hypothetical protein